MITVYVLKSQSAEKTYVGQTDDLDRRLVEHNAGKHSYTKRYVPWVAVYVEQFPDRLKARAREVYFKSAAGRRFLKKTINWGVV